MFSSSNTGSLFGGTASTGSTLGAAQNKQPFGTSTSSQPVFGSTQSSGFFGNSNVQNQQQSRSFGSSTTFGGFGTNQNQTFGSSQTSMFGGGGSTLSGFGTSSNISSGGLFGSSGSTGLLQDSSNFIPVKVEDGKLMNICTPTTRKLPEEYRWEHYQSNTHDGQAKPFGMTSSNVGSNTTGSFFGSSQGSMFGTTSATTPKSGAFGNLGSTTGGLFGTNTTQNTGVQQQKTDSMFGSTAGTGSRLFDTSATTTTSAFGQQAKPAGGLLTGTNSTFGSQTGTSSLFGQTSSTPFGSFGASSSTTASATPFRLSNTPSTTAASSQLPGTTFGTQPSTSTFGTATFGQTSSATTDTSLGSTTQPATGFGFGSSLTSGATSTPTSGLFSNIGGLQGTAATSQPSATGAFGSGLLSQSSFLKSAATDVTKPAGTGLFGSVTTTPSLLTGSTTNTVAAKAPSLFGAPQSDSFFKTDVSANPNTSIRQVIPSATSEIQDPYKLSSLFDGQQLTLPAANAKADTVVNSLSGFRRVMQNMLGENAFLGRYSPYESGWITRNQSLTDWYTPVKEILEVSRNSHASPGLSGDKPRNRQWLHLEPQQLKTNNIQNDDFISVVLGNFGPKDVSQPPSSPLASEKQAVLPKNSDAFQITASPKEKISKSKIASISDSENIVAPILTKQFFSTHPTISSLKEMSDVELMRVADFKITHEEHGSIMWPGYTDLRFANLDDVVSISHLEVSLYGGKIPAPPVGCGLNKQAIITLKNCHPQHKLSSDDQELKELHQKKVKLYTERMGARFIFLDLHTWTWKFEVDHFSKYGLPPGWDEDDNVLNPFPGLFNAPHDENVKPPVNQQKMLNLPSFWEYNISQPPQTCLEPVKWNGTLSASLFENFNSPEAEIVSEHPISKQSAYKDSDSEVLATHISSPGLNDQEFMQKIKMKDVFDTSDTLELSKNKMDQLKIELQVPHSIPNVQLTSFRPRPSFSSTNLLSCACGISEAVLTPLSSQNVPLQYQKLSSNCVSLMKFNCLLSEKNEKSFLNTDYTGYHPIDIAKYAHSQSKPMEKISLHMNQYLHDMLLDKSSNVRDIPVLVLDRIVKGFVNSLTPSVLKASSAESAVKLIVDQLEIAKLNIKDFFQNDEDASDNKKYYMAPYAYETWRLMFCHSYPQSENAIDDKMIYSTFSQNIKNQQSAVSTEGMSQTKILCLDSSENDLVAEQVGKWLEEVNSRTFQMYMANQRKKSRLVLHEGNEINLVTAFHLLTAGKVSEAIEFLAADNVDTKHFTPDTPSTSHLLFLIALYAKRKLSTNALASQLTHWETADSFSHLSPEMKQLFYLLSGQILPIVAKTCLDWRTTFGAFFWYSSNNIMDTSRLPHSKNNMTSLHLRNSLMEYRKSFCDPDQVSFLAPVAPYCPPCRSSLCAKDVSITDTSPLDLQYHLLQILARCSPLNYSCLTPSTHTPFALDYSLAWPIALALCLLEAGNYKENESLRSASHSKLSHFHIAFSTQLEMASLWHWSCFVSMWHSNRLFAKQSIQEILQRNLAHLCDGNQINEEIAKLQIARDELGIPPFWIFEALGSNMAAKRRFVEASFYYWWAFQNCQEWDCSQETWFSYLNDTSSHTNNTDPLYELPTLLSKAAENAEQFLPSYVISILEYIEKPLDLETPSFQRTHSFRGINNKNMALKEQVQVLLNLIQASKKYSVPNAISAEKLYLMGRIIWWLFQGSKLNVRCEHQEMSKTFPLSTTSVKSIGEAAFDARDVDTFSGYVFGGSQNLTSPAPSFAEDSEATDFTTAGFESVEEEIGFLEKLAHDVKLQKSGYIVQTSLQKKLAPADPSPAMENAMWFSILNKVTSRRLELLSNS